MLRRRGIIRTEKVPTLDKVIKKIQKYVSEKPSTVLSEISLEKCDKLRDYRNAFAHPEDFLIVKLSSTKNVYTLKPKKVVSKDKENAYVASQYDLKTKLKTMAEESLGFAYNPIKQQLEN